MTILADDNFLVWLADQFVQLVYPIVGQLDNADAMSNFFAEYGWDVPSSSVDVAGVQKLFGVDGNFVTNIESLLAQTDTTDTSTLLTVYGQIVAQLIIVCVNIQSLPTSGPASGLNLPLQTRADWTTFSQDLVQGLVVDYLGVFQILVVGALALLGVVTEINYDPGTTPRRLPYVQKSIQLSRLSKVVSNPTGLYTTSTGVLDFKQLFASLQSFGNIVGVSSDLVNPAPNLVTAYYGATAPANPAQVLRIPLGSGINSDESEFIVSLILFPVAPQSDPTAQPNGLVITTEVVGNVAAPFSFPPFTLTVSGGFESDGAVMLYLRPGGGISLLASPAGTSVDAKALLEFAPDPPGFTIGSQDSNYFQISGAGLEVEAAGSTSVVEFSAGLSIDDAKLALSLGDADSFISEIVGGSLSTEFKNVGVDWSSKRGLTFKGSMSMMTTFGIHSSIGPVDLDSITIGIAPDGSSIALEVGVSGSVTLGPVSVSVDKVGAKIALKQQLTDPSQQDAMNSFPLSLEFKPPDGLGLAIDAGPVSGGGYISFDEAKGEYAGIFSLGIDLPGESIDVNIIGLLDTKLPNGAQGYSFLMIVCVSLPPIELGFGFTLDGIGGVAGINRSMSLDALRAGLKAHNLDSIFFPPDDPEELIAHAPQIISEVSTIFPVTQGAYVFGLLLELGWGTPTIVEAELGVIIELPDPIRLAILGSFKAGLPTLDVEDESELLVLIKIDILGTIDFEQKQLAIDGTIYDSHVVDFSISGDMALRYSWGGSPNFAFSLGGFAPNFTQIPPGFPKLNRFTVALGSGGDSLTLTSYLALTSNSAQVGADLELHASAAGFTVHGYMGFDALFIFTPFSFTVDVYAGLDLLQGSSVIAGISLDLTLTGPNPWHAHGTASLHILFFSVSVNVDLTIGSPAAAPPLPSVAVIPLLVAALSDSKNWKTQLPDDAGASVVFATTPAGDQTILVHPRGILTVDENVVPLNMHLDKFGNDTPSDASYLQIPHSGVTINSQNPDYIDDNTDMFARGQFENLTDAEKLSLPAYSAENGGVKLGSSQVKYGSEAILQMGYDTYYIEDMALPPRLAGGVYNLDVGRLLAQNQLSAQYYGSRLGNGAQKYATPGMSSPISIRQPGYAVVSGTDLSAAPGFSSTPSSQVQAQQALDNYLTQHPEDTGKYQVINVADASVTP